MSSNAPTGLPPILSYPEAAALVAEQARSLHGLTGRRTERVDLLSALGRVLASSIAADRDQPPFPRSTRDGFACRAADLTAGRPLTVVGQLRAGEAPLSVPLRPGEAIEIMTGAPVPAGADAILMVEHAERDPAANTIAPSAGRTLRAGENIVPRGAEAHAGSAVLHAGARLTAAQIAAAAACGAAEVDVCARPRVAIIATGDELVELDQQPLPQQIRNSNSYALAAQVQDAGGLPDRLPIARDTHDHLAQALDRALGAADLLLLSGGVSMGQYDLVEDALAARKARFFFTGVQMQPGKPVVFGQLPASTPAGQPICFFGLPGNPVSTMVTFHLFVAPLLRALGGEAEAAPLFVNAELRAEFRTRPGLTRFLPAHLESAWDRVSVEPIAWQGSGDLAATARANCFLVVPPDRDVLPARSMVTVLLPT